MKQFLKYIAIIVGVFALDFLSKFYLLNFFVNKWGDSVYDAEGVVFFVYVQRLDDIHIVNIVEINDCVNHVFQLIVFFGFLQRLHAM